MSETASPDAACPNSSSGCKFVPSDDGERNEHLKGCFYQLTPCNMCDQKHPKKLLPSHMMGTCEFRPSVCDDCQSEFSFNETELHRSSKCPKRQVKCEFCEEEFVFQTLAAHLKECEKKMALENFANEMKEDTTPVPLKNSQSSILDALDLCEEGFKMLRNSLQDVSVIVTKLGERMSELEGQQTKALETLQTFTRSQDRNLEETIKKCFTKILEESEAKNSSDQNDWRNTDGQGTKWRSHRVDRLRRSWDETGNWRKN